MPSVTLCFLFFYVSSISTFRAVYPLPNTHIEHPSPKQARSFNCGLIQTYDGLEEPHPSHKRLYVKGWGQEYSVVGALER